MTSTHNITVTFLDCAERYAIEEQLCAIAKRFEGEWGGSGKCFDTGEREVFFYFPTAKAKMAFRRRVHQATLHGTEMAIQLAPPQCPRCLGLIPSNQEPGRYSGAKSRAANVEICSACGEEEALILLCGPEAWPIQLHPIAITTGLTEEGTELAIRGAAARCLEATSILQDPELLEALMEGRP